MNYSILIFIGIVVLVLCVDIGRTVFLYVQYGTDLVRTAQPFTKNESTQKTLLVLGDSTAVGVGVSNPQESIAGLLAQEEEYTYVENYAVSGARAHNIASQWNMRTQPHYTTVLIQIGANDVIRFRSAHTTIAELDPVFKEVVSNADEVLWIMAGNIGGAPFFPYVLRPWYTKQSLLFHDAFSTYAMQNGITYINLYTDPAKDVFIQNPHTYFALDFLHPSAQGYAKWFAIIQRARYES